MLLRVSFTTILATAALWGQLTLVPSEPVGELRLPAAPPAAVPAETKVRSSVLTLLPAGDPIYLGEEKPASPGDQWRTYSRPQVDAFSRDGLGLAIQGFDVISYLDRHAEQGRKEFAFEHAGITWLFATADHLRLFARNPEQYLPQYGGFCTYSVGRGFPATADPRVFTLEGNRLYLFFDKAAQTVWQQDQRSSVVSADRNWPKLHR